MHATKRKKKHKSWDTWNLTNDINKKYLFMENHKNITTRMAFQFS